MTIGPNRGVALISVLWIMGLLAIMAASFTSSIRTEARLAHNQEEAAKAEALADAGVHRAVFKLLDLDPETAWGAGETVYAFSLGEGDAQVRIEDEDGKIDLNGAPLQLLAGLFVALGLPEEDAQMIADRIGDFRDKDSEPEPLGAEDGAYFDAGLAQGAADRPFATESELLRILGMTQSLYEQVRPYVTVYSGAEGIDPTRAPRPVLEALPGITPQVVEALLMAGHGVDPVSVIEDQLLLTEFEQYILPSRELVFTIRVLGRTRGGGRFLREAVIELDTQPGPALPGLRLETWGFARYRRLNLAAPTNRHESSLIRTSGTGACHLSRWACGVSRPIRLYVSRSGRCRRPLRSL